MRINEIICEDQQVDEFLGGVGRAIGRGLGSLAKGYGYATGIPKAMSAAAQRGKAASMANIGYGQFAAPAENPIYRQELDKRLNTASAKPPADTSTIAGIQQEIQRLQALLSAEQAKTASGSTTPPTDVDEPPAPTATPPATDFAAKRAAAGQTARASMTRKSDDDLLNMFKSRAPATSQSSKFSAPKAKVQPEIPGITPAPATSAASSVPPPPKDIKLSQDPKNVRRREKRAANQVPKVSENFYSRFLRSDI